jgi:putative membrane protein
MMGAALHAAPVTPHDIWAAWSWEPGVVLSLSLAAVLYAAGAMAVWRNAGPGRGIRKHQAAAFALGWLTLVIALVSPLHRLGETLFSAHMAQHELLMTVAAPLLVLGRPLLPFLWALPAAWRRMAGSWASGSRARAAWEMLSHPVVAWGLHGTVIWLWHAPSLYQASVEHEAVHALQHLSFLGTALLFWWTALRRRGTRLGSMVAIVALFTTAIHTSLLGALLTFSPRIWYPLYLPGTAPWRLTPLEDQQLAGLIMWIPAGLAYAAAALALLGAWLVEAPDQRRRSRVSAAVLPLLLLAAVLSGCERTDALSARDAAHLTGGSAFRGAQAIRRFGCGACHVIPGIAGAEGEVGPPLGGVGGRAYIAGVLTNTPDHMVRWIVNPRAIDSLTAMPNLGVTEGEARDIAAYLYTRR